MMVHDSNMFFTISMRFHVNRSGPENTTLVLYLQKGLAQLDPNDNEPHYKVRPGEQEPKIHKFSKSISGLGMSNVCRNRKQIRPCIRVNEGLLLAANMTITAIHGPGCMFPHD